MDFRLCDEFPHQYWKLSNLFGFQNILFRQYARSRYFVFASNTDSRTLAIFLLLFPIVVSSLYGSINGIFQSFWRICLKFFVCWWRWSNSRFANMKVDVSMGSSDSNLAPHQLLLELLSLGTKQATLAVSCWGCCAFKLDWFDLFRSMCHSKFVGAFNLLINTMGHSKLFRMFACWSPKRGKPATTNHHGWQPLLCRGGVRSTWLKQNSIKTDTTNKNTETADTMIKSQNLATQNCPGVFRWQKCWAKFTIEFSAKHPY